MLSNDEKQTLHFDAHCDYTETWNFTSSGIDISGYEFELLIYVDGDEVENAAECTVSGDEVTVVISSAIIDSLPVYPASERVTWFFRMTDAADKQSILAGGDVRVIDYARGV